MIQITLLENLYVAPRRGACRRDGREIRRAVCGHDVYLSARGVEAIDERAKDLVCGPCSEAVAQERGAGLCVYPGRL